MALSAPPDALEPRQNLAPVACQAPNNQPMRHQQTHPPENFVAARHASRQFSNSIFSAPPRACFQTHAANVKRRRVTIMSQPRKRGNVFLLGPQAKVFRRDSPAYRAHASSHRKLFVLKKFTARFPARGKNLL